jgi:hypothetical protein
MTDPTTQRTETLDALRDHPERIRTVAQFLFDGGDENLPFVRTTVHRLATEEPADLPTWDDLSDLDKGAALLHLHKREWEGGDYAEEHYPASFFDHPALTAMWPREASRFAAELDEDTEALSPEEHKRLYDLALAAERANR